MARQSTAPGPVRILCYACKVARPPQVMTRVHLEHQPRPLCERCYDKWLDSELDLDKLDVQTAQPIVAQAAVEARAGVLIWLGARGQTLFSISAPRE
jgi:hypothetical protein